MFSLEEKHFKNINKFIFAFTALCLLVFFFAIPGDIREYINGDYTPQVNSLFEGHWFVDVHNRLMDRHPPLTAFTFFLVTRLAAAIGLSRVYAYMVFIIVIVSVSNIMLYHITNVLGYRIISLITSILFATCPFIGILPLKLISEPMFIFFTFWALYVLMQEYTSVSKRLIQYVKIGVSLGFCMLSRPIGIEYEGFFIFFIFACFAAPVSKKLLFSIVMVISSFVVILPWEHAMYKYNHSVRLLSSAGVYATRDGMSFNKKAYRQHFAFPADVDSMLQRFYKNYDHYQTAHEVHLFLLDEFHRSPITVFKLYYIKAQRFWYGVESQNPRYELFNKLLISVYLALCFLGMFTAFRLKGGMPPKLFFIGFILLNWFTAVMFLPLLRYLVPVIGILFIFSAFGVWKILHYLRLAKDLR